MLKMPIQRAQLMPEIGRNAISSISQTRIAAAAVKDWIFLVSIAFFIFFANFFAAAEASENAPFPAAAVSETLRIKAYLFPFSELFGKKCF